MKFGHIFLMVCLLGLGSILLVNCGGSSPTSSSSGTATPTATGTVVPSFNLSGTVTYTGSGSNNIYAILAVAGNSGHAVSVFQMPSNGGSYSFTGITTPSQIFVGYDTANAGLKISNNNVVEANGSSVSGSGDIVCLVGYSGSCPNTNGAQGNVYSSTSTVNITFAASGTTASGTSCAQ